MLLAIVVLCAGCEAVFTAMEVALGALSRARLRTLAEEEQDAQDRDGHAAHTPSHALLAAGASRNPSAEAVAQQSRKPFVRREKRTLSRPERLLALLEHSNRLSLCFIIVTSLSLWTAGALLSWQALRDGWSVWSLVASLGGVLFFAEAIPLVIAARNPEAIALRGVRLVERSVQVLGPLATVLGGIGSGVAGISGARSHVRPQVTEGELRHALDQAEQEGVIEPEERAMLESAIDFRAKTVGDVMTPRIEIVAVPALMPLRAVLDVAMKQGHSRLPVYEGSTDRIVGIIATKDLLLHLRPSKAPAASNTAGRVLTARDVARQPFFLPESKRINAAIDDLRRQRTLMAIVVEPDGGTAGLVTLEDLLEEIVGEIEDEYDEDEAPLRLLEPEPEPELRSAKLNSIELNEAEPSRVEPSQVEPNGVPGAVRARGIVADASCSVRQAEKFWRRHFHESLVLFGRAASASGSASTSGYAVESVANESLSLAALAQQLLDGVPLQGQSVRAGAIFPSSTARTASLATSTGLIEMEIIKAEGPRLEEVSLVRAITPQEQPEK